MDVINAGSVITVLLVVEIKTVEVDPNSILKEPSSI